MSDFDFLKNFAENIDREYRHEPTDSDWNKLAVALDKQDQRQRRRRVFLAWILPLGTSLAFILLGTMLWRTRLETETMQKEIVCLQNELLLRSNFTVTDTMIHHVFSIQYDTVYCTIVQQYFAPNTSGALFFQKNSAKQIIDTVAQNVLYYNETTPQKQKASSVSSNKNTLQVNENAVISKKDDKTVSYLSVDTSQSAPINQIVTQSDLLNNESHAVKDSVQRIDDFSILPIKSIVSPQTHTKPSVPDAFDLALSMHAPPAPEVPMIRRLRPHNAIIGVAGGLLFPQTGDATTLSNYTFGFNGQIVFGRHLRLLTKAEYGSILFNVKTDALDNFNIPVLTPPTANDILESVEVTQPLWDFSLGLRYIFAPDKQLHPYISMAWVGEQTVEQQLRYEFRNQVTNEEPSILSTRSGSGFNLNGLQLGLGTEWALNKRISFDFEGIYQQHHATSVPLLDRRLGVKGGVNYHF